MLRAEQRTSFSRDSAAFAVPEYMAGHDEGPGIRLLVRGESFWERITSALDEVVSA